MLFAGVQSSDHAFASTGIATAAFLDWPHAAVVSSLELAPGARSAVLRRELEGGLLQEVEIQCPAVLTIQLGINTPRYASLRSIKQAAAKPIEVWSLADLGLRAGDVGEAGSASRVRRMYVPDKGRAQLIEGDAAQQAQAPRRDHPRIQGRSGMSGVLVIAEQRRGELRPAIARADQRRASAAPRRPTRSPWRSSPRLPSNSSTALRLAGVDEIITVKVAGR